jgi:hypothetical protein
MDLSRRGFVARMTASIASLGLPLRAHAQPVPAEPSGATLFTNVRLFDGKSANLREGLRLLIEGTRIKAVAAGSPAVPESARVMDYEGRTLTKRPFEKLRCG